MKSSKKLSIKLNSVKTKLIAIMLAVAIVPLTVAVTINYVSSTSKAKEDAQESIMTQAKLLSSEFSTVVTNTEKSMDALAAAPAMIEYMQGNTELAPTVKAHMQRVNSTFNDENSIVLSNDKGDMVLRSDDAKLSSISDRGYWQDAMKGNHAVSNVVVSASTHSRNICVAVPVIDPSSKKVLGVLHRSYSTTKYHEMFASTAGEAFLIDPTGILAAHSQYDISADDEPTDYSQSPYMTSGKESDVYYSTKAGYPTYLAYIKDTNSGYTICNAVKVSAVTAEARKSAMSIVFIGLGMLVAVLIISIIMANGFTKPILAVDEILAALADGRFLSIEKYTNRGDEFGDMVRNSNSVIDKLSSIVGEIKSSSNTVSESSDELSAMATEIAATTESVAEAVQQIAAGAYEQAQSVTRSAENTGNITDAISQVQNNTTDLNALASRMKVASEESGESLAAFQESSVEMSAKIAGISDRITATQAAVSDINERVVGISGIAAQTNLLSLNASIEAARAGDAGRGFSVVATEIRDLADNSDKLAQEITNVMTTLLNESAEAVAAANEILESNNAQQQTLEATLSAVRGMLADIEETVASVTSISEETDKCVASNKEVSDAMSSLSAISEENAASTETTGASVEELSATVTTLAESANDLKNIAVKLNEEISFFQ
ncbi:MAG: methyl-accepting chemotaxis protein [Lachnospiraceae bacterium]|nr:methyl-accepting chemotaxis protein [Lachnospiraceae bacterium]